MAATVHDTNFFSRRALVFAIIVGVHILLAYAFATGLAQSAIEIIAPPIKTEIIEEIKQQDTPPPPPPPPKQVKKAGIDPKRFPPSEEYYPAASKRLGEEGSPTVKACVGPSGKLSEDPSIAQSSGNARLDEAAIKYAKAGRYIAGSVDGQPSTDCLVFRVKFELKN